MGRQYTIQYITGTSEYNVFICDSTGLNCIYLATISNYDIPYTQEIPAPYNTMNQYIIKIIDINGCEIIKSFSWVY